MPPPATEQVWTLGSLLDWTAKHLAGKGVESARLDAEVLLAHAVGCKRIDLYGVRHAEVAAAEVKQQFRELIRQRLEGCPVAYLVGRKEFYGLDFRVSRAVLIPRPDSEHVVIECLSLAKTMMYPRILDVGTGSGSLPIALARHHPTAELTAIDVSADALEVAKLNASRHRMTERIRLLQGDLFAPLAADEQFHFIVSNPPYIATEDMANLPVGVRDFEPHTALDGGPGGFALFDRLVAESVARLFPGGHLIVEIGSPQEKHARERLSAIAEFTLFPTVVDFSGHPRVLHVQRK